jgi:hypothetical protein
VLEVRVNGSTIGRYESEQEAIECVRRRIKDNANSEPEIFDTETGKPVTPAASRGWREHISKHIGYQYRPSNPMGASDPHRNLANYYQNESGVGR